MPFQRGCSLLEAPYIEHGKAARTPSHVGGTSPVDVAALTSQGDTVACVGSASQSRFRASHRLQPHFTWEASARPQLATLREANRTQLFLLARPTQKKKKKKNSSHFPSFWEAVQSRYSSAPGHQEEIPTAYELAAHKNEPAPFQAGAETLRRMRESHLPHSLLLKSRYDSGFYLFKEYHPQSFDSSTKRDARRRLLNFLRWLLAISSWADFCILW